MAHCSMKLALITQRQRHLSGGLAQILFGLQDITDITYTVRARANGVKLGRRRVKPSIEADIVKLRAKGLGIHKIRKKLGVGTSVVQRVFREVPWRTAR